VDHSDRFCNRMGMSKHVFQQLLCEQLWRAQGSVIQSMLPAEEQLALSLHDWYYEPTPNLQERFQRSPNTISIDI
jgi:hypothetical protein